MTATVFEFDVNYWMMLKFNFKHPIKVDSEPAKYAFERFLLDTGMDEESRRIYWPGYCNSDYEVDYVDLECRWQLNVQPDERVIQQFILCVLHNYPVATMNGQFYARFFDCDEAIVMSKLWFEKNRLTEYALTQSAVDWLVESGSVYGKYFDVVSEALIDMYMDGNFMLGSVCEETTTVLY